MNLICPICQNQFDPANVPGSHCPRCLLDGATVAPGAILPCPTVAELADDFTQYEVLDQLGRGGMGAVFKAKHRELDRFVAIKILLVDTLEDPSFEDRFRREARTLAKLDHPNIVRLYDFGRTTSGMCFLVMELVEGSTVQELIARKKIGSIEALKLVSQLCDALQYAHEQGVVHRDVKPSNVLVDHQHRVRIADFGLAKMLGPATDDSLLTQSGISLGTPLYMAPEQRRNGAVIDHRADLYSLGVMIYEMLTGDVPQGVFQPVSTKITMDRRIDDVVTRALKEDPTERYQAASEVRADVNKVNGAPSGPWKHRLLGLAAGLVCASGGAWMINNVKSPATLPGESHHKKVKNFGEFTPAIQKETLQVLAAANPGCPPLTLESQTGVYPSIFTTDDGRWRLELTQPEITSLEPVRGLPITIFRLTGPQVRDLSPLHDCPIKNLIYMVPQGFNFSQLAAFPLEELVIGAPDLTSLGEILNPELKYLVIDGSQISDLSPLEGKCLQLRSLSISKTRVTDLSPLKGRVLHSLMMLDTDVTSIEPLRGMPLQNVNLCRTKVTDLSPLLDCPNLNSIQCDAGEFTKETLRAFVSIQQAAGAK